MKVCVGLVRWGPRAAQQLPQEDYMMIVPADWTREQCSGLFGAYAGNAEGVRGAVVRVGCLFADAPRIAWEGQPAFEERSCGW